MSLNRSLIYTFVVTLLTGCSSGTSTPDSQVITDLPVTSEVTTPGEDIVSQLELDTSFYKQYLDVGGLSIVASARVNPYALLETRWTIRKMLTNRPDLTAAIGSTGTRFAIMAVDEFTTDIPEHSDLTPADYWDRRARGLGATATRPAVSAGEENILQLPGDPYSTESILVHEFAHAIHQQGMNILDSSFESTLTSIYNRAMDEGLWQGAYAATNPAEYFAEGVQSWFDTNRENDDQHNEINTRDELIAYDIRLAVLIEQVLGDNLWKYQGPMDRQNDLEHLAGLDTGAAGQFIWPSRLVDVDISDRPLAVADLAVLTNVLDEDWNSITSPSSSIRTTINFFNNTADTASVRWVDLQGQRIDYADLVLAPGTSGIINTFIGHLFDVIASDQMTVVGQFRAQPEAGLAVIE